MAAQEAAALKMGRTGSGFLIRVEGHATLRVSPAFHEAAVQCLAFDDASLVVDLSSAEYLDSTFLGCLVDLHQHYGGSSPARFSVAASHQQCRKVFGSTHLDAILTIQELTPEVCGEMDELTTGMLEKHELGPHVLKCHERLADVIGPAQPAFRAVVNRLRSELEEEAKTR